MNWISQPTYSERLQSQGHSSTFQTSETICGKPAGSYKKNPKTSSTVTIPKKARQWSSTPSTLGSRPSTMLKTDLNPDIYSHNDPCLPSFSIRASSVGFFAAICHIFVILSNKKKTKPCPTISAGPDLMYLVFGEQSHRKDLFDGGPVTVYDFCAMLSWRSRLKGGKLPVHVFAGLEIEG